MSSILIASIAFGSALLLVAVFVIWYCCRSRKKKAENTRLLADEGGEVAVEKRADQQPAPHTSAVTVSETSGSQYVVSKRLGDGTCGVVYLARRKSDGAKVAIKVIPCTDNDEAEEAMKEFRLCQALQGHHHVIAVHDVFFDEPMQEKDRSSRRSNSSSTGTGAASNVMLTGLRIVVPRGFLKHLCIVTEYFERGTLFDLLIENASKLRKRGTDERIGLPEETIWDFSAQLFSALQFIHKENVIHRDIKPSNILVSSRGDGKHERLVLTDFGLSRAAYSEEYVHTRAGTYHYMAPEQVQRRYNSKADIWGMGCLIHAMCTARVSVKDAEVMFASRRKRGFEEKLKREIVVDAKYSEELYEFLLSLLTQRPADRPTAEEALKLVEGRLQK